MSRRARLWAACLVVLLLGGCTAETAGAIRIGGLEISDAWARPTPTAGATSAFYLEIRNTGDTADRLVRAAGAGCGTTEIHQTSIENDVMRMTPLPEGLEIPPGSEVRLEPGGPHVMCLDVAEPMVAGNEATLTLEFAAAGAATVVAAVRNE